MDLFDIMFIVAARMHCRLALQHPWALRPMKCRLEQFERCTAAPTPGPLMLAAPARYNRAEISFLVDILELAMPCEVFFAQRKTTGKYSAILARVTAFCGARH
jgi:hypothetical protein